jgi:hypothetical protein
MVAQAQLNGPKFEADTLHVHQLIRSYTVDENAAQWIRKISKHCDGRRDLLAVQAHYRGEGNNSRQIATAQQMFTTLHYKGEKALKFGLYLDKVKEMFNIFHDCGEPQPEAAKLRFIFDTIESPGLTHTISAIRAQLGQDPTAWTFVTAANHLALQIKPTARPGRQLLLVSSDSSPTLPTRSGSLSRPRRRRKSSLPVDWPAMGKRNQVAAAPTALALRPASGVLCCV